MVIPDASSTLYPVVTRGALNSHFDRHGKRVRMIKRVLHDRWVHCGDKLIENLWRCTADAPKAWGKVVAEDDVLQVEGGHRQQPAHCPQAYHFDTATFSSATTSSKFSG